MRIRRTVRNYKGMGNPERRSGWEKLFWTGQVISVAVLGIAAAYGATSVAGLAALDLIGSDAIKKAIKGKKKK